MREEAWPSEGGWWRWPIGLILALGAPVAVPALGMLLIGPYSGYIWLVYLFGYGAGIVGVRMLPVDLRVRDWVVGGYVALAVVSFFPVIFVLACVVGGSCL